MVAMLSKGTTLSKAACRPVIDNDLLSLHNAIKCRRSWQGLCRCGSDVLPASGGEIMYH
jgi:hypothetical protein